MEKLLEIMWKTYEDIGGWIKFSDTKAAAILATNGAILAIVFSKSIDNADFLLKNGILLSSLSLGFLSGLVSIFCAIRCLSPTIDFGEPNSFIYFGHIAKKYDNKDRFNIDVIRTFRDESEFVNQITNQVWINSKVALQKYINVTWAIRFFVGLIFFFALAGFELVYLFR